MSEQQFSDGAFQDAAKNFQGAVQSLNGDVQCSFQGAAQSFKGAAQSVSQSNFKEGICLAFDTATEILALSCCMLHKNGSLEILASNNASAFRKANVELLNRIDALLKSINLTISDVGAIIVGTGPGSFTGVRIGIATAKGLSDALNCPLFGISTLDAIAYGAAFAGIEGKIAVIDDAMRKEVYSACYMLEQSKGAGKRLCTEQNADAQKLCAVQNEGVNDAGKQQNINEQKIERLNEYRVLKPEELASKLAGEGKEFLCLGNGLIKYRNIFEDAGFACVDENLWKPTGEGLLYAFAQARALGKEGSGDAATLLPIYMRLSDAEENERLALKMQDGKVPDGGKIPVSGVADYNSNALAAGLINSADASDDVNSVAKNINNNVASAQENTSIEQLISAQKPPQTAPQTPTEPFILAIESSCDETAAAIVDGKRNVLSNIVASQIDFHARFGGVVPEIASRKHTEAIVTVVNEALEQANLNYEDLNAIAVSQGPGLVGCLVVGLAFAKALSYALDVPIIGVNHLEGHLYANLFVDPQIEPPFVALLVSGGHTMLVHVKKWGTYEVIGSTLDDAVGEAFDKVSKALKLGYPGGPILSKLAKEGNANAIHFPRAMMHSKDLSFSLSGLKTAVITYINEQNDAGIPINLPNLAASFQQAVIDVQVSKALHACKLTDTHLLCIGGGVAANSALREALKTELGKHNIRVLYPNLADCGDNAAMIGAVALDLYNKKQFITLDADPIPRMPL